MGVTRILDLIVIILLATVLLMPRPDASVKPALTLDPERRARVAELQSTLIGRPGARARSAVDAERAPVRGGRQPRAGEHLSRRPSPGLGAGDGDRGGEVSP